MLHGLTAEVTLPGSGFQAPEIPPIGCPREPVWIENRFRLNPRISNGFNVFAGVCLNYSNWYGLRQRRTSQ
jgi:hypothetical protein